MVVHFFSSSQGRNKSVQSSWSNIIRKKISSSWFANGVRKVSRIKSIFFSGLSGKIFRSSVISVCCEGNESRLEKEGDFYLTFDNATKNNRKTENLSESESRESINQFGDLLSCCCFALSVSFLFFLLQLFHSLFLQILILTNWNKSSVKFKSTRKMNTWCEENVN